MRVPHAHKCNFGLHTDACISSGSACTSPVSAYSVVPFKSFRTVPGSGHCAGAHKKVLRKTAPMSQIARSTRPYRMAYYDHVEGRCKLLRGMLGVETCVYKTAGKSGSSPCSLRAASLEKFTGVSVALIRHWNVGTYSASCFKKFSVYCILLERLNPWRYTEKKLRNHTSITVKSPRSAVKNGKEPLSWRGNQI